MDPQSAVVASPGGAVCGRCLSHTPHYDATLLVYPDSPEAHFNLGTTLALINHFDGIIGLRLTFTEIFQILITFLVPFSVATYSAARHLQYLEKINDLPKTSPGRSHIQGQTTMDRGIPGDPSSVRQIET